MVALVTGRWGFLGSLAAAALERKGFAVVGAGRPEQEIPSRAFSELVAQVNPSVIVHCAGPASVPASVVDPEEDRRGSVEALRSVLSVADSATRVLLVSSAAVYGEPQGLPVSEAAPPNPISPYGTHRAEAERLLFESPNPSCVIRVFSAYGEGLRRQLLWDISTAATTSKAVDLQGTGNETRDFIHGEDVAAAIALLCTTSSFGGEVDNVASGRETSVAEVAERLLAALDVDVPLRFTGRARTGDPQRWAADIGRLAGYGFEPQIALEDGIRRYAAWFTLTGPAPTP